MAFPGGPANTIDQGQYSPSSSYYTMQNPDTYALPPGFPGIPGRIDDAFNLPHGQVDPQFNLPRGGGGLQDGKPGNLFGQLIAMLNRTKHSHGPGGNQGVRADTFKREQIKQHLLQLILQRQLGHLGQQQGPRGPDGYRNPNGSFKGVPGLDYGSANGQGPLY